MNKKKIYLIIGLVLIAIGIINFYQVVYAIAMNTHPDASIRMSIIGHTITTVWGIGFVIGGMILFRKSRKMI